MLAIGRRMLRNRGTALRSTTGWLPLPAPAPPFRVSTFCAPR